MTSLSASCSTIRKNRQLHLDPGKRAVMVVSGSATHPSNCTRPWCSKKPHKTRIAHAQTTGRLTLSKAFAGSRTKATAPMLSFLRLPIKSFYFHQYFPHRLLGPPFLPSVASHSTWYFNCHFATFSALKAYHQRINVGTSAIGLSLVTFFGIKKNIVVHACYGHVPRCSTLSKNSTFFLSFLLLSSEGPWHGSRHILLVFLLYTISTAFSVHSFF